MVETVVAELGGLHIAVNNAGINKNSAAEDTTEQDWDLTFDLNTKGVFLCCQVSHERSQGIPCQVMQSACMLRNLKDVVCMICIECTAEESTTVYLLCDMFAKSTMYRHSMWGSK